jgi:hypothetical protein
MYRRAIPKSRIAIYSRKPNVPVIKHLASRAVPMSNLNLDFERPSRKINKVKRLRLKLINEPILVIPHINSIVELHLTRHLGFSHLLVSDENESLSDMFSSCLDFNLVATGVLSKDFHMISNYQLMDYIKVWIDSHR